MKKRWKTGMWFMFAICALSLLLVTPVSAADYKLKIGKRLDIGLEGAEYKSSDNDVVYVDRQGHVTAKKQGTAKITAQKDDIKTSFVVKVKKDANKPALKVAADEIWVTAAGLELENADEAAGQYIYRLEVQLKNTSKKAVNSVAFVMRVGDVTCDFDGIDLGAGREKTFTRRVAVCEDDPKATLVRLRVRAGGMYHTCNYETGNTSYEYASADRTPPKISGFVGKNSYNGTIPYQTVYEDEEDSYDFFKYVKAADNRDGKVKLTVDTSKVDFSKKGTYTITYTAVDNAGNESKAKAKIAVRTNDSYDALADKVLKSIIKKGWSDKKKVIAIYNYANRHIAYGGHSDRSSWEKGAKRGIQTGHGDCFIYYAVVRLLLTRCGIPNLEVQRVGGYGPHWWNMAYVEGGFYHVDACPRRTGGRLCLLTDAQLKAYSKNRGNHSHVWDYAGKPKSATKVIAEY